MPKRSFSKIPNAQKPPKGSWALWKQLKSGPLKGMLQGYLVIQTLESFLEAFKVLFIKALFNHLDDILWKIIKLSPYSPPKKNMFYVFGVGRIH